MPRRPPTVDPELKAHQEWLGYLQPVGLVVAPAAMQDAGWVVTRSGSELIERQERYREALEALDSDQEGDPDDRRLGFSRIETLLVEHLGWSPDQIQSDPSQIEAFTRDLPELGETLAPSAVVPAASGDGIQLLLLELATGTALDQKVSRWRASLEGHPPGALRAAAARNRRGSGPAVQRQPAAPGGGAQGRKLRPSHLHAGGSCRGERPADVLRPRSAAGAEPCVPRSRRLPAGGCAQEEPQLPGGGEQRPGRSGAGGAVGSAAWLPAGR